jgi:YD repeat-containing protein
VTEVNDQLALDDATYNYDQLNRLTSMYVNAGVVGSYTYNSIGNMTFKSEAGVGGTFLYYPATGQPRPHATTSTWTLWSTFGTLIYDANGNITSSYSSASPRTNNYTYDAANRLVTRTLDSAGLPAPVMTYAYDGNGNLVKRSNSADSSSTVYIGGIFEKTNTGAITKYYSINGRRVAMRNATAISYLLSDHLGSTTQTVTSGVLATQTPIRTLRGSNTCLSTGRSC